MPRFAIVYAAVALVLGGIAPLVAAADDKPPVTVFAAASLREAFESAAPAFTKLTGFPVRLEFGGSDMLATQLMQGAPADVFASANAAQTARAVTLLGEQKTLARNRLVVIVPRDDRTVASVRDLGKTGVKLVLAASSVPVGAYARAAFVALAKNPEYGGAFPQRVAGNVISEETDVKAVAVKIALGEADAGVVYATDVTTALAPKVRALQFPPGSAPEAVYPIAVVKNAVNPAGARAFVEFITSPAGVAFLKARGFEE